MPVTINANGLSIIHEDSGGKANATLPDVCLTVVGPSVVPIPYTNSAKSSDLADGSKTVTADGGNSIAIKGCNFSKSSGDAAGTNKGIVSGTTESKAEFITSSPTVKIEGKGVCRLSDQMTMNNMNTMCLAGADNDSVTVVEDPEGTYTVDLCCTYSCGEGFQAPFTLTDAKGTTFKGILDPQGKASVSGLSGGLFKVEYDEDQREYKATPLYTPKKNEHYNPNATPFDIIEKAKQGRPGFWDTARSSLIDVSVWTYGVLQGDFNEDPTAGQLLLNTVLSMIPFVDQAMDVRDISANILTLSKEENRKDPGAWLDLTLSLIGAIPIIGSVIKRIGKTVLSDATRDALSALMREMGKGDPEKFIEKINWKNIKSEALEILLNIITDFNAVLNTLIQYANTAEYTEYAAQLTQFKNDFETLGEEVDKHIPDSIDYLMQLLTDAKKNGRKNTTSNQEPNSSTESQERKSNVNEQNESKTNNECWLCEKEKASKNKSGVNYCSNPSEITDYYAKDHDKHGYTERGEYFRNYRQGEPQTEAQKHYPWYLLSKSKNKNKNKNIFPETHPLFVRCYDEISTLTNKTEGCIYYTRPMQIKKFDPRKTTEIKSKIEKEYKEKGIEKNQYKMNATSPLQAHHIIPTMQMKNNHFLKRILPYLGYDFNEGHNITILPSIPELACFYQMPLHTANHGTTEKPSPYTINITAKLNRLELNIKKSKYCKNTGNNIINNARLINIKIKEISEDTLGLISNFNKKGALNVNHYNVYRKGGRGCCNELSHGENKQTADKICTHRKNSTNHLFKKKPTDDFYLTFELKKPTLEG